MTLGQYLQGQMRSNAMNFPSSDVDLHMTNYLVNCYSYEETKNMNRKLLERSFD